MEGTQGTTQGNDFQRIPVQAFEEKPQAQEEKEFKKEKKLSQEEFNERYKKFPEFINRKRHSNGYEWILLERYDPQSGMAIVRDSREGPREVSIPLKYLDYFLGDGGFKPEKASISSKIKEEIENPQNISENTKATDNIAKTNLHEPLMNLEKKDVELERLHKDLESAHSNWEPEKKQFRERYAQLAKVLGPGLKTSREELEKNFRNHLAFENARKAVEEYIPKKIREDAQEKPIMNNKNEIEALAEGISVENSKEKLKQAEIVEKKEETILSSPPENLPQADESQLNPTIKLEKEETHSLKEAAERELLKKFNFTEDDGPENKINKIFEAVYAGNSHEEKLENWMAVREMNFKQINSSQEPRILEISRNIKDLESDLATIFGDNIKFKDDENILAWTKRFSMALKEKGLI